MVSPADRKEMIETSKTALEHAYAPYSGFKVGAAVLGSSGKVYSGCNVENASYGLSVCAERVAIFKAICEGESSIVSVAVASSSREPAFPCGACLQVIAEFADKPQNLEIHLISESGMETHTFAELLPHSFGL